MENTNIFDGLMGKNISFRGEKFNFIRYKNVGQNKVITTDKKTIVLAPHEITDFLESHEVVAKRGNPNFIKTKETLETFSHQEPDIPADKTTLPAIKEMGKISLSIYEPTDTQKKVQDALLSMLDKVQTNPEVIAQAKSVCDIANTMINMEKSQFEMMKFSAKGLSE